MIIFIVFKVHAPFRRTVLTFIYTKHNLGLLLLTFGLFKRVHLLIWSFWDFFLLDKTKYCIRPNLFTLNYKLHSLTGSRCLNFFMFRLTVIIW